MKNNMARNEKQVRIRLVNEMKFKSPDVENKR